VISSLRSLRRARGADNGGSIVAKDLKIWMNGRLSPRPKAVLPVNSAAVFYATNGSRACGRTGTRPTGRSTASGSASTSRACASP
jgi:hypothetical protein